MKQAIFILILFTGAVQAQKKGAVAIKTLTTAQLTNVTAKLTARLDSAAYLDSSDFKFNPDTKTYTIKRDTIIIRRGAVVVVEEGNQAQGFKPTAMQERINYFKGDTLLSANSGYPLTLPTTTATVTNSQYQTLEYKPIEVPQFSKQYTIETNGLTKEQQDILDLKWQVEFLTSIIDGLYDIIDRQNQKLSLRF